MSQPILSQINIYPLKSAGGIPLVNVVPETRGLAHDRRWMVVDDSGQFMTQRTSPKMALINTKISAQTLNLNAPGMSELSLPLFPTAGESQEVEIWGDRCEAWTSSPQTKKWISEFLGESCNIVFMPDHSNRPVDPDYTVGENQVSFSDGFPFLLISEASLNDLNKRLPESVAMMRFRPNLVVKNTEPFEEDFWKFIRIGDCELQVVKPCSRCVLTTVDPETGKFSGKEPLRTLATFRKENGKVLFGQNLLATKMGEMEVGMPVEIISKK
ncbi:MAG: MOSC domain-containing protein [SAR324 cluster bacterium]|nr:MOSC domain-containing protein [SAR324 cluster bacterium]MDP7175737.1 MOSC domain-containing protein [SAR324 cluster bacterium]MDP7613819.1 MOSC domain-containing protein [SAR324 cluster bacterium]